MNALREWMDLASASEKKELADLSGTTIRNLYQLAGAYRTGGGLATRATLAYGIEHATRAMNAANPKLPIILRTEISPECRGCDLAQRCLGDKPTTD